MNITVQRPAYRAKSVSLMEREYRHLCFAEFRIEPHDCNANPRVRAVYERWLMIGDRAFVKGPSKDEVEAMLDREKLLEDIEPMGGSDEVEDRFVEDDQYSADYEDAYDGETI